MEKKKKKKKKKQEKEKGTKPRAFSLFSGLSDLI